MEVESSEGEFPLVGVSIGGLEVGGFCENLGFDVPEAAAFVGDDGKSAAFES